MRINRNYSPAFKWPAKEGLTGCHILKRQAAIDEAVRKVWENGDGFISMKSIMRLMAKNGFSGSFAANLVVDTIRDEYRKIMGEV